MPSVQHEIEIVLKLCDETLKRMLELKENETMQASDGQRYFTAIRKNGHIIITFTEEVEVEFDMRDYAPDNSWRD